MFRELPLHWLSESLCVHAIQTLSMIFFIFFLLAVAGRYPCIFRAFIKWCPGAVVVAPSMATHLSVYSWPTLVILYGMSKWMAQLGGFIFKVHFSRRYINLNVALYRIDHVLPASLSACLPASLSICPLLSIFHFIWIWDACSLND